MAHGKITIHVDFDRDTIKNYIGEGVLTLSDALRTALEQVILEVQKMEEVPLRGVNTYDVDIAYNLEDHARGVPEPKSNNRMEILLLED